MEPQANLQACIEACEECLHECQTGAAAHIRERSTDATRCLLLNLDCADICAATLTALARGSEHHGDFCALCEHICRECAAECAKLADRHEHCLTVQKACEACAAECAKHATEKHT